MTGLALALAFASASCVHVSAGPEEEFFNVDSIVDVYGNVNGFDDWDGDFFDLGLFTGGKGHNEIFHIEIGPLFAFGVGFVGTRVRILPLQFGVGSLFYNARPKKPNVVEATIDDCEDCEECKKAGTDQPAKTTEPPDTAVPETPEAPAEGQKTDETGQ